MATDDSLSDRLLADADPPETPDECPLCGADMSIESAVFCSVTCQVEAADRLEAAEDVCKAFQP